MKNGRIYMIMSTKMKNGAIGSFWGMIGLMILISVLIIPTYNYYLTNNAYINKSLDAMSIQEIENNLATQYQRQTANPIMRGNQLSPKIILTSSDSININLEELNFKLSDQYKTSIELFKTKAIQNKNPEKAFKKFIEGLGLSIDQNGNIIDITGNVVANDNIMCQVVGYFPDKPYIKPNCGF